MSIEDYIQWFKLCDTTKRDTSRENPLWGLCNWRSFVATPR